ncbi:MAG: NADH-quinone oxidoreductase subunit NuoE [Chloroflexota bacterium]|nr:NADH-quinone oxidoreductase subunit NuoE [Chloroflexota bacterium]
MKEAFDLTELDEIIEKVGEERGALIPILQRAQRAYGYLSKEVLRAISEKLSVPLSRVLGVATFYSQFHLTPRGRHVIQQCDGTACHVRGASRIIDTVQRELGIEAGETTPDLKLTYEVVYCLGCCAIGPAALVDGQVVGKLNPDKMIRIIENLE